MNFIIEMHRFFLLGQTLNDEYPIQKSMQSAENATQIYTKKFYQLVFCNEFILIKLNTYRYSQLSKSIDTNVVFSMHISHYSIDSHDIWISREKCASITAVKMPNK